MSVARKVSKPCVSLILLVLFAVSLLAAPAAAQSCLPDGDVTQDGTITPEDGLQALQHFLGIANPLLDACQQNRANVLDPESSEITPADALCIFRRFLTLPSCLDALGAAARLIEVSGDNQRGQPGEVLPEPFVARAENQFGTPLAGVPVTFTRLLGDGEFVGSAEAPLRTHSHSLVREPGLLLQAQAMLPEVRITVFTASDGTASVRYRPGQEPLQVVAAQAQNVPNQVIFRITLGPLAGNGIEPVNIALGGGRGYTANIRTNNVSVFDATGQSRDVVEVINLTLVQTPFGAGGILGVAVNTLANRLYVYGLVDDGAGSSVVLLVVDTTTNAPPADSDGDNRPGLTLLTTPASSSPELIALAPGQILGLDFGNLVTVDEGRRRVYAVVPGAVEAVEENGTTRPVTIVNGDLIVIEDRDNAPAIVARVRVGEVPTGVAVNTRTNRVYVTNRGFIVDDASNDTMTVVDGSTFTVIDTLTVGRSPLGVTVDEGHNVVYVSNLFGAEALQSAGAVSVINGETNTVLQTIPTAGTTDLAVLVGDAIDRIYVNDAAGTVIECDITALTAPAPCQIQPELSGLQGKLAINDSNTLLFEARRFDNAVAVFDLATHAVVGQIRTGVSVRGLAVDTQTGTTYVSDFLGDELFAVDLSGALNSVRADFVAPGQVEVDETHGRIYIISPHGIPPLLVLNSVTREPVATLKPEEWVFGSPNTLAIDEGRNLLYLSASSSVTNRLLVFDGARLLGKTGVNDALVADIVVGVEDGTALAQGVAVDTARNLIYVTRFGLCTGGCEPSRNALVVVRGPEFDPTTRTLLRVPEVVAEIPNIGLNFGGDSRSGHRVIALDPQRNLIYVAGAFGSIGAGEGFGSTAITVLDGLKIVDAQGQVTPNPAAAILGIIPIKVLDDVLDDIVADYTSPEMAFNVAEGLLYVVTRSTAPFTEGFLAVINSNLVIDANRNFMMTPHPDDPTTLISLIATIPAGLEPEFIAVDTTRNRVIVSNQSPGALLVLQGLSVQ